MGSLKSTDPLLIQHKQNKNRKSEKNIEKYRKIQNLQIRISR